MLSPQLMSGDRLHAGCLPYSKLTKGRGKKDKKFLARTAKDSAGTPVGDVPAVE